jgi:hypothetical protein
MRLIPRAGMTISTAAEKSVGLSYFAYVNLLGGCLLPMLLGRVKRPAGVGHFFLDSLADDFGLRQPTDETIPGSGWRLIQLIDWDRLCLLDPLPTKLPRPRFAALLDRPGFPGSPQVTRSGTASRGGQEFIWTEGEQEYYASKRPPHCTDPMPDRPRCSPRTTRRRYVGAHTGQWKRIGRSRRGRQPDRPR